MSGNEIEIFARIRPQLCWEKPTKCLTVNHDAIGIAPAYNAKILKPIVSFYQFNHVFEESSTNKEIFDHSVKKLCNHSATATKGQDSVFFVYGQTASGKTETILGSRNSSNSNKGVLLLSVEHLLNHRNVDTIDISVIESYGTKQLQIRNYDLLNQKNDRNAWSRKVTTDINRKTNHAEAFLSKTVSTIGGIESILELVRNSAHFAATSRQPQSNRGHIVYILRVTRKNPNTKANVLFVDLAGSDGKSAFTTQFTKQSHPTQLKLRKEETKVIGYGLTRLQKFVSKYRKGGTLNKFQEGNLRTLLYPYFQPGVEDAEQSPKVSALFTLSPSVTNTKESRNTLRSVKLMANITVVPERCSWRRSNIDEKETRFELVLDDLNDQIRRLSIESIDDGDGIVDIDNNEFAEVAAKVRQSIMLKQAFINNLEVAAISQNGWDASDIAKQQALVEGDDVEKAEEQPEDKLKEEHQSLKNYWSELKYCLMAVQNNEKHNTDDKEAMPTKQTKETIQKELEQIETAVHKSEQRMSTVFNIPLEEIMKQTAVDQPMTWADLEEGDEDGSSDTEFEIDERRSDDENENDNENAISGIDASEEKKEKEKDDNVFGMFINHTDEDDDDDWFDADESLEDVNLSNLYGKQGELQKYETTLRSSLMIISKVAPQEPLLQSSNHEVNFIEQELEKVRQELMEINTQVSAINIHNNTIAEALEQDTLNTMGFDVENQRRKSAAKPKIENNNAADATDATDAADDVADVAVETDVQNKEHENDEIVNEEDDFDDFYKRPYPRYIEIRNRGRTMNLIIRSMRCHSDLFVVGYQNDMSVACDIITKLERDKIVKVVRIETGLAFADYDQPCTCIKFIVCCGEFGEYIHGYQQRRMIEVFERADAEMTGFVSVEKIQEMELAKKLKATEQQQRQANKFLLKVNNGQANMIDFIKYASILIHPLLSDRVFQRAVRSNTVNNALEV